MGRGENPPALLAHQTIKEARPGGLFGRSERTTEMKKTLIALGAGAALSVAAVLVYRMKKREEEAAASSVLSDDASGDASGD